MAVVSDNLSKMKKTILLAALILTIIFGCKKSEETSLNMATTEVTEADAAGTQSFAPSGNSKQNAAVPAEQKIIRQANIRFKSDDLNSSYERIFAASKKYSGVVHNDVEGKDPDSMYRNITVRIPGNSFDAFISDISKGVEYFDRKEISAEDVTAQFIDLEARLKAKKTLEARYLDLLRKASKISEILEIERQLSSIREEIEAQEGQLRYMQNRISLSTINIEIYKPLALGGGTSVSYAQKMWTAIKSGFNGILAFFIGVLYIWPFILILAGLFFILRRRFRKNTITP